MDANTFAKVSLLCPRAAVAHSRAVAYHLKTIIQHLALEVDRFPTTMKSPIQFVVRMWRLGVKI